MSSDYILKVLRPAISKILRPLVRILLRHGIACDEVAELLRHEYVMVAEKEFVIEGRKQTTSRISILTGLNRKEVQRLRSLPESEEDGFAAQNRASKVVNGWLRDELFHDEQGEPMPLPLTGKVSFSTLVKKYSGDMPVRAVLDELIRSGPVMEDDDDMISLVIGGYIPELDESKKIEILGDAAEDLLKTLSHNLQNSGEKAHLQLTLAYNNLPYEILDEFRSMSKQDALKLLQELNTWISKHDRDVNPDSVGTGRYRAGLGVYYFEEEYKGNNDA